MSQEVTSNEEATSTANIASGSNSGIDAKKIDTQADKAYALIASECGFKVETTENHTKRLQNLRQELNYISATDWMYDSLDKKPQQ